MLERLAQGLQPWPVTRAAGLLAYLFLWLSVVAGLMVTASRRGWGLRPARWNAVHQWAAAWSLYAVTAHLVILLYDTHQPFRWPELLLPFASRYRPGAVALGVYALYALLGVQLSSYLRSRVGTATWRLVHYLSLPAYTLALVHGLTAGSDNDQPWLQVLYWGTGAIFTLLLTARLTRAAWSVLRVPRASRYDLREETSGRP